MKPLLLICLMAIAVGCEEKQCKQIEIITTKDIYIDFKTGDTIKVIMHRPQFGWTVEQWNIHGGIIDSLGHPVLYGCNGNGGCITDTVYIHDTIYRTKAKNVHIKEAGDVIIGGDNNGRVIKGNNIVIDKIEN